MSYRPNYLPRDVMGGPWASSLRRSCTGLERCDSIDELIDQLLHGQCVMHPFDGRAAECSMCLREALERAYEGGRVFGSWDKRDAHE
jgi:hypothetical protein